VDLVDHALIQRRQLAQADEVQSAPDKVGNLDGCAIPQLKFQLLDLHAIFEFSAENADSRPDWWRRENSNPRDPFSNSIDGILPSLSTLSGLRKSICVQEILFAKDSALPPDLSGYRIRELEAMNLMNVEHQTKV